MSSVLSLDASDQFHRQTLIEQNGRSWDQAGVRSLRVLLVGAGNIGDPVAVSLAIAGVGWIDIVDKDTVTGPNLSRGVSYRARDVGQPKAVVLAGKLREINPEIHSEAIIADVRWDFGTARFRDYDVVTLATHDLASRLHVNKYVHLFPGRTRALIEGAISDLSLSVQTILPGLTSCYACPLPPDRTDPEAYAGCNGVVTELSVAPAATNGLDGLAAAALMAKEAVLIGAGLSPFFAEVELRFDGDSGRPSVYRRPRRASCADHHRATEDEILELPYNRETPVVHLLAAVAARCGVPVRDVRLFSLLMITRDLVCACGQVIRVMRPQKAPMRPQCPVCKNADPNRFRADPTTELSADDAVTLGDYGMPDGQALEGYVKTDHYYLLPDGCRAEEIGK